METASIKPFNSLRPLQYPSESRLYCLGLRSARNCGSCGGRLLQDLKSSKLLYSIGIASGTGLSGLRLKTLLGSMI